MNRSTRLAVIGALAVSLMTACAAPEPSSAPTTAPADAGTVSMTIYRSPDCSCCHVWADVARRAGWTVASADKLDMNAFKAEIGVPLDVQSCHTALIGGYFVEGHVPMAAIERLLAERPAIDGIALPGMPAGSPGMGGVQDAPFEILAVTDGVVTPFGSY
jgi:hypothetical protein